MSVHIRCKTDQGKIRKLNEDYVLTLKSTRYTLLVVADGMGGCNAGEIASHEAAVCIRDFIFQNFLNYEDKEELLRDALVNANTSVYNTANTNTTLSGMGTTVTCALILENGAFIGHVGDSRAYLLSNATIEKLTKDHSLVQELLNNGSITEEEAEAHPQKNLITRAVGTEKNVIIDIKFITLAKEDVLILCSDGLTNYVHSEEILKIVLNNKETAIDELVDLANEKGGNDNISIIIARMEDE